MPQHPIASPSTSLIANTPAASLRERSDADLIQRIRGPADGAYTLDRTRACLRLYYEADMTAEERAAMIEEFGRALRDLPRWTIARAFDGWIKTGKRRPTPAEIRHLAEAELKPLTDELARRKAAAPPPDPDRQPVDRATAAEILARAGFTPARFAAVSRDPMAAPGDLDAPQAESAPRPELSEEHRAALAASRAANRLVQQSLDRRTTE